MPSVSINGVELRNIQNVPVVDGEYHYTDAVADVWYKGKKLGTWSEHTGGEDEFTFDTELLSEAYNNYKAILERYGLKLECWGMDFFMEDLNEFTWLFNKPDVLDALRSKKCVYVGLRLCDIGTAMEYEILGRKQAEIKLRNSEITKGDYDSLIVPVVLKSINEKIVIR